LASVLKPGNWREALRALGGALREPREGVVIDLREGGVVATRLDRNTQVARREEAVAAAPSGEGPAWRGVVQALEALLAKPEFRDAAATIVVSNQFVRYAVAPWREGVTGDAERLALVRHMLARLYGAHVEGWEVRISLARHGAAALAAAMEPELLAALRAVTRSAGLILQSVEPLLVAGFNRACTGTPASYRFASVEPGRVCLARIEKGTWQEVRCQRLDGDWQTGLPVILARELLLDESSHGTLPVYVHAPAADGRGFVAGQWGTEGWRPAKEDTRHPPRLQAAGKPAKVRA
jgi:hypothetical protein